MMKPRKKETKQNELKKKKINQNFLQVIDMISLDDQSNTSISEKLNWIEQALLEQWKSINHVHIATLLNKLTGMGLPNRLLMKPLVEQVIKKCTELLSNEKSAAKFELKELGQMLLALPGLPVVWSEQKSFIIHFVTRVKQCISDKIDALDKKECAIFLSGLAKLRFNFEKNSQLIQALLAKFDASEYSTGFSDDKTTLYQLWQFCAYAKAIAAPLEGVDALMTCCEKELDAKHGDDSKEEITSSNLQLQIYELLMKLLREPFLQDLKQEHRVGCYYLDIAFPSVQLNIEVDGPFHYVGDQLSLNDKFRDKILIDCKQWAVVRIPFFKWQRMSSRNERQLFLMLLLEDHKQLFSDEALQMLQGASKKVLPKVKHILASKKLDTAFPAIKGNPNHLFVNEKNETDVGPRTQQSPKFN